MERSEDGVIHTVEGNSGDACKQKKYPVGSNIIHGVWYPGILKGTPAAQRLYIKFNFAGLYSFAGQKYNMGTQQKVAQIEKPFRIIPYH